MRGRRTTTSTKTPTKTTTTIVDPDHRWEPDDELAGFQRCALHLTASPLEVETQAGVHELTATLIRRGEPTRERAVLYIHGWNDYFFQSHVAEFWAERGFDFYALELRRYGRGLRPGMLAGYIADLDDYVEELDLAIAELARHHDRVTLHAHSTGGLVAALYADAHPSDFNGLVLNSPWLDLQGSALVRAVTATVMRQLGSRTPITAVPLPDNGFYARTVRSDLGGEWTYDSTRKTSSQFGLWAGWLRAIIEGHRRVNEGLAIHSPVQVLISSRSDFRRTWDAEALSAADTVLDIRRLAAASPKLGRCVTLVRIDGGLHDLALSRPAVRATYFDEIERWLRAYVA